MDPKTVLISQDKFDNLLEYSLTIPTGKTIGKQWKCRERDDSGNWTDFFKVIDTPAEVCRERAEAESDEEILPVIERMAGQLEPLGEDEARWPEATK